MLPLLPWKTKKMKTGGAAAGTSQAELTLPLKVPFLRVVTAPKIFVLATPALVRGLPWFEKRC